MLVIAVTGGICDGKSTVLQMFEECGALTISADKIARELFQPGKELWERAQNLLAPHQISAPQELTRRQIADLIAVNVLARRQLNHLLHPLIVAEIRQEVERARAVKSGGALVVEVPLLIEIGMQGEVDRILVAYAGYALQLERLTARISDSEKAALYLQTQLPTSVKVAFADWVIPTHQSLESVKENTRRIWTYLSSYLRVE